MKSIMPVAYYECCLLRVEELFDGVVFPGSGTGEGKEKEALEVRVELSPSARRKCLKGRDMLLQLYHKKVHTFLWGPREGTFTRYGTEECRDAISCVQEVAELAFKTHVTRYWHLGYNVLMRSTLESNNGTEYICDFCLGKMREAEAEGKQRLWDELPRLYGLGDWESVKQHET